MSTHKNHWNLIYSSKRDCELSWYQSVPSKSIELIEKYVKSKQGKIIDVGGGNSNLTKLLCNNNYRNFTVIDISEEAIERCRAKLLRCKGIPYLLALDILDYKPQHCFQIWHDRAVFHFFTTSVEIKKYVSLTSKYIEKNGILILATFSLSGPDHCSGLPIIRYDERSIGEIFINDFRVLESFTETHITPSGNDQEYIWVVLEKF